MQGGRVGARACICLKPANTAIWLGQLGLAILLSYLALSIFAVDRPGETGHRCRAAATAPKKLRKVMGCFVATDFIRKYDLEPLGLHKGDWAYVRYYIGSIPGMGSTPDEIHVAIYSADEKRGWLLLAVPNSQGGIEVIHNAYRLTKDDSGWTADEGNGGNATYRAMSRFATWLTTQPLYCVRLQPGKAGCTQDY